MWQVNPEIITSVSALIVSFFALLQSHQSASEQKQREKREELRSSLEKLIEFQEEHMRISRTTDPFERSVLLRILNAKRSIHTHVAKWIIAEIPSQISPSEYHILAIENALDSDFYQARRLHEKAVAASNKRGISNLIRNVVLRGLSASFYWQEPYKDIEKGRQYYQEAVNVIVKTNELHASRDEYLLYTVAFTYREWSEKEVFENEDYEYALDKLNAACNYIKKLPILSSYKPNEIRGMVNLLVYIGGIYFRDYELDMIEREAKISTIFNQALKLTQLLEENSDIYKEITGHIYQGWAVNEMEEGHSAKGRALLLKADEYYQNLPQDYPNRDNLLEEVLNISDKYNQIL